MLDNLQYHILKWLYPPPPDTVMGAYSGKSKLDLLGNLGDVSVQTFIDFGCGEGNEVLELARRGAKYVVGIDSRAEVYQQASQITRNWPNVLFSQTPNGWVADTVLSIDSFEHFGDPAAVLSAMSAMLRDKSSRVRISFGPTWYHPLGGHLFSVFPWSHLLFSEKALIRWRSNFKSDGATRFGEVAGGLNQMTIRRFEHFVADSPLEIIWLEVSPIRKMRWLHNHWTREFTTSIVRCELAKR